MIHSDTIKSNIYLTYKTEWACKRRIYSETDKNNSFFDRFRQKMKDHLFFFDSLFEHHYDIYILKTDKTVKKKSKNTQYKSKK